jgi:hypothetical protein
MTIQGVEKRFGAIRAAHPVQWLCDSGYITPEQAKGEIRVTPGKITRTLARAAVGTRI